MLKAEDDKFKKTSKETPEVPPLSGDAQAAVKDASTSKPELNLLSVSSEGRKGNDAQTAASSDIAQAKAAPPTEAKSIGVEALKLGRKQSSLISFGAGTLYGAGKEVYNMVAGLGGVFTNYRQADIDEALRSGDTSGSCYSITTSLKNTGEDLATAVKYVWNKGLIPTLTDLKDQTVKQYNEADAFGKGEMLGHAGTFVGTFFIGGGAAAKGALETANLLKADRLAGQAMGIMADAKMLQAGNMAGEAAIGMGAVADGLQAAARIEKSGAALGLTAADMAPSMRLMKTTSGAADTSFLQALNPVSKLGDEISLSGKMMPLLQSTPKLEGVATLGKAKAPMLADLQITGVSQADLSSTLSAHKNLPGLVNRLPVNAIDSGKTLLKGSKLESPLAVANLSAASWESKIASMPKTMARFESEGLSLKQLLNAQKETALPEAMQVQANLKRIQTAGGLADAKLLTEFEASVKSYNKVAGADAQITGAMAASYKSAAGEAAYFKALSKADSNLSGLAKYLDESRAVVPLADASKAETQLLKCKKNLEELRLADGARKTEAMSGLRQSVDSYSQLVAGGDAQKAAAIRRAFGETELAFKSVNKVETFCTSQGLWGESALAVKNSLSAANKLAAGEVSAAKAETTAAGKLATGEVSAAKAETAVAGKLATGEAAAAKTETAVAGKLAAGEVSAAKTETAVAKIATGEAAAAKLAPAAENSLAGKANAGTGNVSSVAADSIKSTPEYVKVLENKAQILSTLDKTVSAPVVVASGSEGVELQRSVQQIRESLKMLDSANVEMQRNGLSLLKAGVEQFNDQLRLIKGLEAQDALRTQEQLRALIGESVGMKPVLSKEVTLDSTRFKAESNAGQLAARADGLQVEGISSRWKDILDVTRQSLSGSWTIAGLGMLGAGASDAMVQTAERIARLARLEASESGLNKNSSSAVSSTQTGNNDPHSRASNVEQKSEQSRTKDAETQAAARGPSSDMSFSPVMQAFSRAEAPMVVSAAEQKRLESVQHGGVANWRLVDGGIRYVQSVAAVNASDTQSTVVNQPRVVRFAGSTESIAVPKIVTPGFDPNQMIRNQQALLDSQRTGVDDGEPMLLEFQGGKRKIKNGTGNTDDMIARRFPFLITSEGVRRSSGRVLVRAEDAEKQRVEKGGGSTGNNSLAVSIPATSSLLAAAAATGATAGTGNTTSVSGQNDPQTQSGNEP